MLVGIQGLRGSACDAAADVLLSRSDEATERRYLTDAESVLGELSAGRIDRAVIVAESPLGTAVEETVSALEKYPARTIDELLSEVRHCVLSLPGVAASEIRHVASHPVPLRKHQPFLNVRFPGHTRIPLPDTGLAAEQLATGKLPPDTAVIALPTAAAAFDLSVLIDDLPANDGYQSRFLLVGSGANSGLTGPLETL